MMNILALNRITIFAVSFFCYMYMYINCHPLNDAVRVMIKISH